MKIDWKKLWELFEEWHDKAQEDAYCKSCYRRKKKEIVWKDQMRKIESLVGKEISRPPKNPRSRKPSNRGKGRK